MRKKNIINNKFKDLLLNQKGMALLTTLIFIFILITFGVALLTMTSNDIRLSVIQRDSTKAFYVAESGIEKALWYLNTPVGGKGFDWRGIFNEGTTAEYYDVTVETVSPETETSPEIIKITSTGVLKPVGVKTSRKRKIEVKAKKGVLPFNQQYIYAISTDTLLELKGNIAIEGDIHSNDAIEVAGSAYNLDGNSYAVGTNEAIGNDGEAYSGSQYYQKQPEVIPEFYEDLAKDSFGGGLYYYDGDFNGDTFYFNTDNETITGIHFIEGNVEISTSTHLFIEGGAIFATGTITSKGNAQITHTRRTTKIGCTDDPPGDCDPCLPDDDPLCDNPFALVAVGDINLSGTINTQGIIQTKGNFVSNGDINVNPGAIYADHGVFHGGGGDMNVVWPPEEGEKPVPGTGLPYYIKISWEEK